MSNFRATFFSLVARRVVPALGNILVKEENAMFSSFLGMFSFLLNNNFDCQKHVLLILFNSLHSVKEKAFETGKTKYVCETPMPPQWPFFRKLLL